MSLSENITELFDRYLADSLSVEEKILFEDRMEKDEAFARSYEDHIQNIRIIKSLGIRDEMKEIMDQKPFLTKAFKTRYLIPIGIAAALALALLFLPNQMVDNNALFNQYFSPYPNAITGRSTIGAFHEAMEFYTNQQYSASIENFKNLNSNDTTRFYKGISYLAIEEPEKALTEFRNISPMSMFKESVVWYKALSFLLLNETDSIHLNLKSIKIGSTHYTKAQEIISELKSPK